ncbi:unnamed protein product [Spirodela intermedia]|uniref:Biogenesis of lysosome-related organelles complex 1 subunit 1 n=1 Tax=Spirodela intermedia TaxID=51605 RepID=A0A7I8LF19_SPIIN|nr:unnamed protein product [Spirodela intermedia]
MKKGKAADIEEDVESSLLRIVQEHQRASLRARDRTEEARREALRAASRVSELLVGAVNGGIEEAFVNEKRIEQEIRALMSTALRYSRQADQWHSMSQALNSALKEIGDFENWMKTMDYDCRSIGAAIFNIHRA